MNDAMMLYAQQLRLLVDGYYHQELSMEDYRAQRKVIFDQIEKDFAANRPGAEQREMGGTDEPVPHV
jgi:hypothetical protein